MSKNETMEHGQDARATPFCKTRYCGRGRPHSFKSRILAPKKNLRNRKSVDKNPSHAPKKTFVPLCEIELGCGLRPH
jgi:hypothetical protein